MNLVFICGLIWGLGIGNMNWGMEIGDWELRIGDQELEIGTEGSRVLVPCSKKVTFSEKSNLAFSFFSRSSSDNATEASVIIDGS